ncbi:MAG: hypothetical protein K2X72_37365 [Reyranella sp.]|nr:hypothetical protein [Reyranella sp.]
MPNHAMYLGSRETQWSEPDLSILDNSRNAVPAVPLDLVPDPWRAWIAETASATGAPQDYILQTVLAGVAGVCGRGGAGARHAGVDRTADHVAGAIARSLASGLFATTRYWSG